MAKLSTKDRNKLPASEFGIPNKRKFPLNDAAHVEDAARKVGYAQGADKKPLARKILSRARKYNLDTSGWKKVKLFAQEQVPPMSDGTSIGNAPPHTLAPYYEEDELMKRVKGLSNSNEAQTDVLTMARNIANRIHAKYVADQKPPTGNQNCQLCTWCAEANFRGINVLPRPIYSPRDPAFDVCAESIVMNPDRKEFPNFQELNDWIMTQPNARFYVHVKWNGGTGGHEFMLINFNIPHILDPQQGIFEPTTSLKIFNDYFGNIDYSESYICRLDDRPLNKALLTKMNSMTMLVPWDESKDIPYMREHGMLCDEDEQYLKDHGLITETSNPIKYTMRPAKESDLDFVYYSELETVDENKNDPKVQRYIKQDAKDSLGHTKIIVVDNNDVGVYQAYATNYWGVREGKRDWWYLAHIYIKPEYRSHGIGTEIIKNDISEHDKILLQVMKSNPRAKKLYESLGFVVSQENDHGGLVMRLDKSKTVQEYSVDNHDYWEIDEEDGTFTTKLTSKILFAMSKLYYYWAVIPESSWNIKSIDEFDTRLWKSICNDDNWDMDVSAPGVWRDLLDETIIKIRGIIWVINDFDKLPEDRQKIHEGPFTFPHEELINVLTDIRDTAKNVYETNPLLKVKNLPYKIETPKDKKALNDIRSVGTLVMSVLKDWTNHYVPEKLKNAYRHGPYRELFTEGFIDTIQEGFVRNIRDMTLIPVRDFKYDKVFYGDPVNGGSVRKLDDKPLFVTPHVGLASIFVGRRNIFHKLSEMGYHRVNLGYDEWASAPDRPLTDVHVYVRNAPDLKPFTIEFDGYIHTINCSQLKNNIYRYPWMSDTEHEVLIAKIPEVKIDNVQKLHVTYHVRGISGTDIDKPVQEYHTDLSDETFYRFEYDGEGIYEAFRKSVSFDEWKKFKQSDAAKWLPVPPNYKHGDESFFTKKGYDKFMKLTYPYMLKYLDESKIREFECELNQKYIRYRDEYQVVYNKTEPVQEGFVDTIQEQTWQVSRGNDFTYPFKCPDNMSVDEELMFEFVSDIGFLNTISDDLVVPFCKKKGFEKEAEEALVRKANALGWGDGDYTDAWDVINDFDHTSYGELALYPPSFGELVSDHEAYIIFDSSCDKPSTHIRVNITLDGQKFHAQIVSPEQVGPITIAYDHSDEMFSGTREMVVNRIGRDKFINACKKKIMQLLPAELITFLKTINRGDCYTSTIKGFSEIWFYNVDDLAEIYLRDDFPYEHPDVKKLKRDGDWEKKLQILEKNQIKNIAICVGDFDDYPIYFKTATGELVNSIDNKVIAKSWKEFKSKIKPYTETIQEGAFQDIKNGVNPFSDNLVFHVSTKSDFDGRIFQPRVPEYLDPYDPNDNYFEDNTSPRVCFSSSIEGALNGIMVHMERDTPERFDKMYVYIPEKPFKDYKHKTTKQLIDEKKVWDANVTREVWITEPVRMKLYGTIRVDQVSAMKMKSTVKNAKNEKHHRRYFTFKWHWIVPPSVLEKSTRFDYSTDKIVEWLSNDLKKFKYGLIRNGRLMTGNVSDADYNKYWVYHSAQEVDEAGGGNCYDMVEYEANYLKSYGVSYKTYFMSFTTTTNKPINTHTICVVPYEGKFIYIEQAFKRVTDEWGHMRRRTFDTLNEIFQYVAECAADAEDKKQINFGVWDYTNEKIDYGTPIQEFMKWIYTHTKMIYDGTAKPFKPTKEAYVPMRPSRFVLEGNDETITVGDIDLDEQDADSDSDDDTTVEEKETTKTVTEKIETDNDDDESDYDVSNINLGTFGSDTSDVQNEYDPKEIEILMKLMASEADAMNEYMDGAKDTNIDVLRRLYADIANEERFHMEQLLFAKSEITGEKYEPKDPDVKKEYEELLAMGMDEATAMSTAVDKFHIRGSVSEDDGDIDIDELKEDMTTVEMAMNFFSRNFDELMTVLESGTYDPAKTSQAVNVFMESFYMEDVAGPAASDMNRGNWNQGPKGIIGALKKALGFILNMLGTIIRKFGNFLKKIKDIKKKYKTIHDVNGRTWKALFKDGVKFYFFNPKSASTGYVDADSLNKYSDIITHLTALCSKQVVGHYDTSDISKDSLNELGTLRFDNIQKGIAIIERTNLQQIKYVIDESTSQMLDKLCFGTNNNANINGKTLSGKYDSATGEYRSFNVYNFLEDQSARWKKILEYENEVLDGFQNVKDQQLNTSAYRDAINGMKACIKGAKAFVNALSADLNQLMKINQIALDEMKKHDAEKTSEAKKGYDAKQDEARARVADELNVFGARSTINP